MPGTRWGILGAGHISSDYATAIKSLSQSNNEITAIAARDLERARTFAAKFGIRKSYGSYQELADDPEIDIIYIGTIPINHAELVEMALNAGKAVLCEVPLCMNAREVQSLIRLAKEKKLFYMEEMTTSFFPSIHYLQEILKSKAIGEPEVLTINCGVDVTGRESLLLREMGGGCFHTSCFCAMMAKIVFPDAELERVAASGTLTDTGSDSFASATLYFDKGRVAQFVMSIKTELDNSAIIAGSNSKLIKLPYFWSPSEVITESQTESFPLPLSVGDVYYPRSEGLQYVVKAVSESLQKGELENPLMTHEMSLWIMKIMDEIRRQVGVRYDADDE